MISKEKDCCVYIQPPKTLSSHQNKIYKPPTIPLESETTYKKSYLDNKNSAVKQVLKNCRNAEITGMIDFKTTNHMSYTGQFEKPVEKIFPRNHLKCGGSGDFTSTYLKSYFNPGVVKTHPMKPIRGKLQYPERMECRTTMTESFQDPGVQLKNQDVKPKCVFVSDAKIDNLTINRLSFRKPNFQKRESCRSKRCTVLISSKLESNTIYKSSYEPPGGYL